MAPEHVIAYCGGTQSKTAVELGVTRQVINNWVRRGKVPLGWQIHLHNQSHGKLKLDKRRNGK